MAVDLTAKTPGEQIRDHLIAYTRPGSGKLTDVAPATRIFTRPLKEPDDWNAAEHANDATPYAFDPLPPRFVLPSIVIGKRIDRSPFGGSRTRSNRFADWTVTLAYYGPPNEGGENVVMYLAEESGRALHGRVVTLPGGLRARLQVRHEATGSVPIPEFPGRGYVMVERIGSAGVYRRE